MHEYADLRLGQAISQIQGVAQVMVYGAQKFAMRVQVDPEKVAARGLVDGRCPSGGGQGRIRRCRSAPCPVRSRTSRCRRRAQLDKARDYTNVVVAWRNGTPIKLNEVATISESVENNKIASWFNGDRSIVLAIQRQPDANTVAVVDAIKDRLPALRAGIPASIKLELLMDRSISVRQAVSDVQHHMMIALVLVLLVIFLFLRKLSATIIPGLAVPISIVGTFAVMYVLDFSINNMTLLALTLCIGFVVDDAIVMLENIVRHVEGGMRPFEAALKGSREIGFTIVSITLSLIAVFIPVLLMGGIVGRVFREFAVTISIAIIISGFVSLTLTPMLCARMLRGHDPNEHEKKPIFLLRWFEAMFNGWLRGYEWSLDKVIKYKPVDAADHAGDARRHDLALYHRVRRASSRPRIPASWSSAPRPRPTPRSRRWSSGRPRSPTSSARTRPSTTSIRRSARADRTPPPITAACSSCWCPRPSASRCRW